MILGHQYLHKLRMVGCTPLDFQAIEIKIYYPNGFDKRENAFSLKYKHSLNMFIIIIK